jgi:hypothetical protein
MNGVIRPEDGILLKNVDISHTIIIKRPGKILDFFENSSKKRRY